MVSTPVIARMDKLAKALNKASLEISARIKDYQRGKVWEKVLVREVDGKILRLMNQFDKLRKELEKAA